MSQFTQCAMGHKINPPIDDTYTGMKRDCGCPAPDVSLGLSEGEARWLVWFLSNGSGSTKALREDIADRIARNIGG
jgi:hypothetical protein